MAVFVSDIFDIDREMAKHGNKIFLAAGVGAGKSTWVKDILTKKGNVLFITSRRAKVDEDISNSVFEGCIKEHNNDNQTLMTNAKLFYILRNAWMNKSEMSLDEFLGYYDYIVIDEVHSIVADALFADSAFALLTFVVYLKDTDKTVVVMTGTPEIIEAYFKDKGWYYKDLRKECNNVLPAKIHNIRKKDVITKIQEQVEENKIVYFVNQVKAIPAIIDNIIKSGIANEGEIAVVVSEGKWKKLDEELSEVLGDKREKLLTNSKVVYRNIVDDRCLPADCKILISTSRLKEGVDIENDNVVIICDNHILSNLIQFCGRIRVGNGQVYIVQDAKPHDIKHEPLLYRYAQKNEVESATSFWKEDLEKQVEIVKLNQQIEFILYMNKNPYIRFNFIEGCFQLFSLKYKEEIRLMKEESCWEQILEEYCKKNSIMHHMYLDTRTRKELVLGALENAVKKELKFFGKEDKEKAGHALLAMLGVPEKDIPKQKGKINEYLEKLGYDYEFVSDKGTAGEERDKSYWKVVKVDREQK